tara:strand:+ start:214 stop:546 length:333 start_codon:yes stop_codon:yes gene_type:complete
MTYRPPNFFSPSLMEKLEKGMFKDHWLTKDIDRYLKSPDYRKLSNTVHGEAKIFHEIKFAWFPIYTKNNEFVWLKKYVQRRLEYLNVRGKENILMEDYVLAKIKGNTNND